MTSTRIHRRTLLRGLGGLAIALPALEIMRPAVAQGATAPKRYFVSYHGVSTGAYGGDMITPTKVGTGYELLRSMKPVGDLAMQSQISIVTGLRVPYAEGTGSAPSGGRTAAFHRNTVTAQICGRPASETYGMPTGPTSDQLVAAAIAGDTKFPFFGLRVQPTDYDFGSADHGCISWAGEGQRNDPIFSPSQAYGSMFSALTPVDPAEAAAAAALLARRRSALDLVDRSIGGLLPQLGAKDQQRMERHYDEIRALEKRLENTTAGGGSCEKLPTPADPTNDGSHYNWEGEEKRAELMIDLVAMAFACDLTRVVPFVFTHWKSYMGAGPIVESGNEIDVHELGHFGGTPEDHGDGVAFGVRHFTRLASKLNEIDDVDGGKVLDNTAMVLTFEGGWGYDPEGGSSDGPHSTENMVMLVAGGAGGLKRGHHVRADGKHPANVIVTAMEAVGAPGPLGDVTGNIPELLT